MYEDLAGVSIVVARVAGLFHSPSASESGFPSEVRSIVVDSGVLNPDLLKGKHGERLWPKARLRDRIDAIIAHEWAEAQTLDHDEALNEVPKTDLPVRAPRRRSRRRMRHARPRFDEE